MMSPVHVPWDGGQAGGLLPFPFRLPLPPHLCPESSSNPVPSFPPLPSPGLSSLQVGKPGLEFWEGEGHGCGVAQRLWPFAGLREPGVTFPQVGPESFPPQPRPPLDRASRHSFYFPTCCTAQCPLGPLPILS